MFLLKQNEKKIIENNNKRFRKKQQQQKKKCQTFTFLGRDGSWYEFRTVCHTFIQQIKDYFAWIVHVFHRTEKPKYFYSKKCLCNLNMEIPQFYSSYRNGIVIVKKPNCNFLLCVRLLKLDGIWMRNIMYRFWAVFSRRKMITLYLCVSFTYNKSAD